MSGLIVVGVDGSPESEAALRWAYEEARRRGATLEPVLAFSYPWSHAVDVTEGAGPTYDEAEETARETVSGILQRAGIDSDEVAVKPRVEDGSPAEVLLRAAKGADLLVVGSRGRGGFAGLLLGSVSQQVVQHATCPVAVIRGER